ncbi:ion transporter [Breoghania sp.]|uniref:ion transporter n=1 Tax=Breoghania sp. TaxID=2065378 RepID=UPI002AA61BB8|nr:ion transporter [Breoghania sp.]
MRDRLRRLVQSRRWEWAIIAIIALNAVTLGMETSATLMNSVGGLLTFIDTAVLVIFVVEIAARIFVYRLGFFRQPWSLFDFAVVALALLPTTGVLSVLRALRVLRVLRLVSVVPSLQRVIGGLISALPGMGSIFLLMSLVFYIFSVMATNLYGSTFPEWFGDLGASAYTLFQVMTLESWSMGIVRPVMEAHPYAWMFFLPFILATAFTVLNLFIGIIVSAMQEEHDQVAEADRQAIHDETSVVLEEVRAMRRELADLRRQVGGQANA